MGGDFRTQNSSTPRNVIDVSGAAFTLGFRVTF
jgi:hypothetical protein